MRQEGIRVLTTVGIAALLQLCRDGRGSGHDGGDESAEDDGELHLD